jgi:hypothetical protein
MKDLKKMMGEDSGPDDGMKKEAKLKVLKELRSMASGMMGDDIKSGMAKKVTVASDTSAGLKAGLEKARGAVDEMSEKSDYDHSGDSKPVHDGSADSEGLDDHDGDEEESVDEHNASANEDSSQDPNEEHTPESLDAQIKHLQAMRERLAMRKM